MLEDVPSAAGTAIADTEGSGSEVFSCSLARPSTGPGMVESGPPGPGPEASRIVVVVEPPGSVVVVAGGSVVLVEVLEAAVVVVVGSFGGPRGVDPRFPGRSIVVVAETIVVVVATVVVVVVVVVTVVEVVDVVSSVSNVSRDGYVVVS